MCEVHTPAHWKDEWNRRPLDCEHRKFNAQTAVAALNITALINRTHANRIAILNLATLATKFIDRAQTSDKGFWNSPQAVAFARLRPFPNRLRHPDGIQNMFGRTTPVSEVSGFINPIRPSARET